MTAPPDRELRRPILLLSAAAFASAVSARLCDPMLPDLARQFAASPAEVSHVVSGFAVAYGLVQAFFGPLGDRLGKYRLIALTTLLCTLGTLGAALAASLDLLILARVFTGVAAAGIIPLSMAWIGDKVSYAERQHTLARFIGGQIAGVIAGQLIGGVLTDTVGWRWAFGFVCLLYLVIGLRVLTESRRNPLTYPQPGATGGQGGLVAQMGSLFGVPWARVILAVVFVEGMLVFGGLAFVPLYLHDRFALSMSQAGLLMGMFGLGGLSYILFARRLVKWLGELGLAIGGAALIALAWLLIASGPAWGWAVPACALLGLGYYMFHNTLQTHATQMAPQVRGTAVSLFASCFFLGQALGVSAGGLLYETRGALMVFGLAASVMVPLGAVFAVLLRRHHRRTA